MCSIPEYVAKSQVKCCKVNCCSQLNSSFVYYYYYYYYLFGISNTRTIQSNMQITAITGTYIYIYMIKKGPESEMMGLPGFGKG